MCIDRYIYFLVVFHLDFFFSRSRIVNTIRPFICNDTDAISDFHLVRKEEGGEREYDEVRLLSPRAKANEDSREKKKKSSSISIASSNISSHEREREGKKPTIVDRRMCSRLVKEE